MKSELSKDTVSCPSQLHCVCLFEGAFSTKEQADLMQVLGSMCIKAMASASKADELPIVMFVRGNEASTLTLLGKLRASSDTSILVVCEGESEVNRMGAKYIAGGASDVLAWTSCTSNPDNITARLQRWHSVSELLGLSLVQDNLVGISRAWQTLLRELVEIAYFSEASVLIHGESGTGKELLARLIHSLDQRTEKTDIVTLDCTTIASDLSGSELFGHEKGAFTGAVATHIGAIELAHGGTLFLDEIGELSAQIQKQLLRVIQHGSYQRVGSNTWRQSHFRLVCATNRNLKKEVEKGAFRQDLYHRMATVTVQAPSLRERPEDIIPLAKHFLDIKKVSNTAPGMDPSVQEFLVHQKYPGNVRELEHTIERMLTRYSGGDLITLGHLGLSGSSEPADTNGVASENEFEVAIARKLIGDCSLSDIRRSAENAAIDYAFNQAHGNLRDAAKLLGISDRALQMRQAAKKQSAQKAEQEAAS